MKKQILKNLFTVCAVMLMLSASAGQPREVLRLNITSLTGFLNSASTFAAKIAPEIAGTVMMGSAAIAMNPQFAAVDISRPVTVTVFCLHQTLHTGAYNPVNIMVDGQYATAEAKKIDSDSYDAQKTEIASRTFTIDLSQGSSKTFWVNVEWEYGGTYSGVRLDSIECGGNVTLTR